MYSVRLMKELLTLSEKPFTIDGEQQAVQLEDAILYEPLTFSVTYLEADVTASDLRDLAHPRLVVRPLRPERH